MVDIVRNGGNEPAEERRRDQRPRDGRSVLTPVLRIPLFFKLFLANAAIIVAVTVAGAFLSSRFEGTSAAGAVPSFMALAVVGIALSLAANAAIVWIALTPIRSLEHVAARIRAGDHGARAERSKVADRDLERLARTFNEVLDAVADQTGRLREMAARAQSATEEERRRLARELHDGIAQSLAALNIRVKLARNTTDSQVRASDLDQVSGGIADAILELRRMARGLRPPALEMLGLAAAIESHARSATEAAGFDAMINAENVTGLLSPDAELAVYRILQESLSNVIRHSGASQVRIDLAQTDDGVQMTIEDDGQGFDSTAVMVGDRGLGIFGMKERASVMGGELDITSRPGHGTRVVLTVPILESVTHGG
jgi:signal transduction histidine kinase